jgi:hypothetical protein
MHIVPLTAFVLADATVEDVPTHTAEAVLAVEAAETRCHTHLADQVLVTLIDIGTQRALADATAVEEEEPRVTTGAILTIDARRAAAWAVEAHLSHRTAEGSRGTLLNTAVIVEEEPREADETVGTIAVEAVSRTGIAVLGLIVSPIAHGTHHQAGMPILKQPHNTRWAIICCIDTT